MSISKAIAPHLPYLRRFARALSGTQSAGRRLCCRHASGPDRGPVAVRPHLGSAHCPVPHLHRAVELHRPQPQAGGASRRADGGRSQARIHHAAAAAGLPAELGRRLFQRGYRPHSRPRSRRGGGLDRSGRPRNRGAGRDRCARDRGRTDDRHGSRRHPRRARPSRHGRRPHPCRGAEGDGEGAAGSRSRRYSARRRQLRDSMPSTTCCGRSRCR